MKKTIRTALFLFLCLHIGGCATAGNRPTVGQVVGNAVGVTVDSVIGVTAAGVSAGWKMLTERKQNPAPRAEDE